MAYSRWQGARRNSQFLPYAISYTLLSLVARCSTMSLASLTGSSVKGAESRLVTFVPNRSAAWRMGRGKDASC